MIDVFPRRLKMRRALISGVTGQDGSYLAELLLAKGYEVHGIKRRSSSFNTGRIDSIYQDPHVENQTMFLHFGDVTDSTNIIRIVQDVQPEEIYNLAAQSHVAVSFDTAEYTANADAIGTLRLLEAVRLLKLSNRVRFYQASTSELFGNGNPEGKPLNESSLFCPRSPYGAAKLYAYWITVNYREAYGIYGCNGILFNHESERRGETFVSRKITRAAARIALGIEDVLYLGNLDARRDWGHARDYVEGMWLMLQQATPDDYVLATGECHTVRQFAELAFREVGIDLVWQGSGRDEVGVDRKSNKVRIRVDTRFLRPTEVAFLLGDASKAQTRLNWKPRTTFSQLVCDMVAWDLAQEKKLVTRRV